MRYLKMLGLAAALAMAMSAYLGIGGASAAVFCTTKVTPCGANWDEPAGTEVEFTSKGTVIIETTGGTVLNTCTKVTEVAKMLNTGGGPGVKVLTETLGLTFENCTRPTKVVNLGETEISNISGTDDGTVIDEGTEFTVETIFGDCTFSTGTGTDLGVLEGGSEEAALGINTVLTSSGGFCPGSAKWTATVYVTKPKNISIREE